MLLGHFGVSCALSLTLTSLSTDLISVLLSVQLKSQFPLSIRKSPS